MEVSYKVFEKYHCKRCNEFFDSNIFDAGTPDVEIFENVQLKHTRKSLRCNASDGLDFVLRTFKQVVINSDTVVAKK